MSDDDTQMINDLQTGIKALRKQNEILLTALKEIVAASRPSEIHLSNVDKIIKIERIAKIANKALEDLKS